MANPVLVEILRGDVVESAHRGAVVVCDAKGRAVFEAGDSLRPVFPRSAVKVIQALPLVESGAADALGFGDRELALACASHRGEARHVELAASMLARGGMDLSDLECGTHWPSDHDATLALARSGGQPSALHNNCSGKHSGFLCTCGHLGLERRGYVEAGHPFQELIRETMRQVTGADHGVGNRATDGCSIPTYAVPLQSLAQGFARLATAEGISRERAKAARRLMAACMREPFFVAGTGHADTVLMGMALGRIFVKTGAEGVYCGALPELGLGFALKCDDGASRASEAMVAALLAKLLAADAELAARLEAQARQPILSRRGAVVGSTRPTEALA